MRYEFLYDKKKDKTDVYIWKATRLLKHLELSGTLTSNVRNKVKEQYNEKFKDEK